jgi:1-acyl-sn-glycerol-3-phosphate acyltransferase
MLPFRILRALIRFAAFFVSRITVTGRENIPAQGPYIIVTNHMSKADTPLLYVAFPFPKMRFFAGEKWESHFFFGPLMRAVGAVYIKRGEVDRRALKEAIDALNNGEIFGLAPEGTRSRVGQLIQGKDGAAYLASRANVQIVPVGVVDTDKFGANLKRLRRAPLAAHIGEPFQLPTSGRRVKGAELSALTHYIMVKIAALLPERHWGHYQDSPALAALLRGEDPWPYCLAAEGVDTEV